MFTGLVRGVDRDAIEARLDAGEIVLIPPIGYSPTGELFNLKAKDLAATVASELNATKLVLVGGRDGIADEEGRLCRQLTLREARELREHKARDDGERELLDRPRSSSVFTHARCLRKAARANHANCSSSPTQPPIGASQHALQPSG